MPKPENESEYQVFPVQRWAVVRGKTVNGKFDPDEIISEYPSKGMAETAAGSYAEMDKGRRERSEK